MSKLLKKHLTSRWSKLLLSSRGNLRPLFTFLGFMMCNTHHSPSRNLTHKLLTEGVKKLPWFRPIWHHPYHHFHASKGRHVLHLSVEKPDVNKPINQGATDCFSGFLVNGQISYLNLIHTAPKSKETYQTLCLILSGKELKIKNLAFTFLIIKHPTRISVGWEAPVFLRIYLLPSVTGHLPLLALMSCLHIVITLKKD